VGSVVVGGVAVLAELPLAFEAADRDFEADDAVEQGGDVSRVRRASRGSRFLPFGGAQGRNGRKKGESKCKAEAPLEVAKAEGVGEDADGAEGHGEAGQDRAEEDVEVGVEQAGGEGDADEVVDDGPGEVLAHDVNGAAGDADGGGEEVEVGVEEEDVAGFASEVGAGGHGEAGVGLGEGCGVVDAVADHGDAVAGGLEGADVGEFVGGEETGVDVGGGDSGGSGDGGGGVGDVSGEEDGGDVEGAELGDGGGGGRAEFVGGVEDGFEMGGLV
jgi:hypothetical protein